MSDTRLIGREEELAALVGLLAADRVVTLWGGPGMGKSTLLRALVATRATNAEAEGMSGPIIVDLERASTEGDVVSALARELDVSSTPVAVVGAIEGLAPAVLAFDHAERCLDALASFLARVSAGVPIVVASREQLRTTRETVFEVRGLAPARAAALFVARAERVRPGVLGDESATVAIDEIVALLDGGPLAIELAAGRVRSLGVAEIARRLPRDPSLLRSLERDSQERHRTLEASIRSSWDLLDDAERAALVACGVFRGTFTTADLCAIQGADATLVVEALHAKSLLRIVDDGGPRLSLLHAIEDFAVRAFEALPADEQRMLRERHARRFTEACESLVSFARGRVTIADRASFRRVEPNIAHAVAISDARRILVLSLGRARVLDGRYREAFDMLATETPEDDDAGALLRFTRIEAARRVGERDRMKEDLDGLDRGGALGRALAALVRSTAAMPHDLPGRVTHTREAARIFGELGFRASEASARARLGDALRMVGRTAEAEVEIEAALAIASTFDDPSLVAQTRTMLSANLADMGRIADASAELVRAREVAARAGDHLLQAQLMLFAGLLAQDRGAFDEAVSEIVAATERFRQLGMPPWIIANAKGHLARVQLECGALQAAATSFGEAILLASESDPAATSLARAGLAVTLARLGEHERAQAELTRATSGLREHHPALVSFYVALVVLARGEAPDTSALVSTDTRDDMRFCKRLLAGALAPAALAAPPSGESIVVSTSGENFRRGKQSVDLRTRRPLRALLTALAQQRIASAGVALSAERLIEIAWPGERIAPDAARNRLRVSIAKLRSLGLEGVVLTQGAGYVIDPTVRIELESPK